MGQRARLEAAWRQCEMHLPSSLPRLDELRCLNALAFLVYSVHFALHVIPEASQRVAP